MTKKAADSRKGEGKGEGISGRVRALDRGLAILEALSLLPEASLTSIAAHVGLAFSTTHRMLETLKHRGFVQQSPSGLYSIGLRSFEVGSRFLSQNQLPETAQPLMRALVDDTNETVNLAVRDGLEALYIQQAEGQQRIRMFTRVGARAPLHCSGVGKALLAWLPREEIASMFAGRQLREYTNRTFTDLKLLLEELDETAHRGYALDFEEYELGVRCVAAPVRDKSGGVVAAVSVSGPLPRFSDELLRSLSTKVPELAREISARLGWIPD